MVTVFKYGYEELARQVNKYGSIRSGDAIERVMRLGATTVSIVDFAQNHPGLCKTGHKVMVLTCF